MESLFLLDNELMVELSEDAQEHIQGGNIDFDLDQSFSLEQVKFAAANGPLGSVIGLAAVDVSSEQSIDYFS